jgi:putative two-component system response regulator
MAVETSAMAPDKPLILVVDDDPAVTELLELKLDPLFAVRTTNDPRDVQALARTLRPQAIVCDIDMPGMDGGDVCRRLSEDPRTRHIPVLYLTSMVSNEEVAALDGEVGGRPGISKSAPVQDIAWRITQLIAGH